MRLSLAPLILLWFLAFTSASTKISDSKVKIYVMNGLPPNSDPLIVHCESMGGDFSLSEGRSFSWRFSPGYFATTFYCEFWWNSKIQNVKVFSYLEPHQCQRLKPNYSNICYWQAREDGIYFNKWNDTFSAASWQNKFPW
ncbi:hypothetical protein DCAR_0728029 [Daucus carota subsp. sativus]|uniref:S-protein homolog n=1 Tax=Daucus carota subsp. sativus TaxID=79200 RepID=A0A161X3V2_DAUCS|nr:hypothetical protein DCAR_0728029 [Daucus carota subsp. sativus]